MIDLPKAILFDLDDTILSFGGREALLIEVAEEFRDSLAPLSTVEVGEAVEAAFLTFWADPERYRRWRNRLLEARTMIVEALFAEWRNRVPALTPDVARRFTDRFHTLREGGERRLFPRCD